MTSVPVEVVPVAVPVFSYWPACARAPPRQMIVWPGKMNTSRGQASATP